MSEDNRSPGERLYADVSGMNLYHKMLENKNAPKAAQQTPTPIVNSLVRAYGQWEVVYADDARDLERSLTAERTRREEVDSANALLRAGIKAAITLMDSPGAVFKEHLKFQLTETLKAAEDLKREKEGLT